LLQSSYLPNPCHVQRDCVTPFQCAAFLRVLAWCFRPQVLPLLLLAPLPTAAPTSLLPEAHSKVAMLTSLLERILTPLAAAVLTLRQGVSGHHHKRRWWQSIQAPPLSETLGLPVRSNVWVQVQLCMRSNVWVQVQMSIDHFKE